METNKTKLFIPSPSAVFPNRPRHPSRRHFRDLQHMRGAPPLRLRAPNGRVQGVGGAALGLVGRQAWEARKRSLLELLATSKKGKTGKKQREEINWWSEFLFSGFYPQPSGRGPLCKC